MTVEKPNPVILMVDDDDEDIYLTRRAFCGHNSEIQFHSVHSGAEMFDYLNCSGAYESNDSSNMPDVILLDINIPRENGFKILEKLRADPRFAHVPVTMLTTSNAEHDVHKSYQLGASSYICKSISSKGMNDVAIRFCDYWFGFARLPRVA